MPLITAGKKIGRYEVISLLGCGGMGEVYLAKDNQLGRQVALKILKKTGDPEYIRRFRQEARSASSLNHPNILSVYEFGQYEDFHFIAAELVRGKTLRQIISEKKPTVTEAVEIAVQIGNALAAAHQAGVIHRDIKPENIMLLPDGYVKVLDFGLSKLSAGAEMLSDSPQDSTISLLHTKPGTLLGTVNYMSPEQVRGQPVDGRADIWSLGVILFEMIAGCRPFAGGSVSDVIAAILERPLPRLSDISPDVPAELENIVAGALAKNREERYPSVKDFIDNLRACGQFSSRIDFSAPPAEKAPSGEIPEAVGAAVSPSPAVQKFKNYRLALLLSGTLVLIGAVLGFYFGADFFRNSSPKQIKSTPVATSANVLNAVLSPNAQFIAFVQDDGGSQSLRLRQVTENAESVLLPAEEGAIYSGIQFSPDSNSIFYTLFKDSPTGRLYRIPTIGGNPQKIIEDIDTSIAFSPDGKWFAFIRSKSHEGVDQVIISDAGGTDVRVLSEKRHPERYLISSRESPAWSPDGETIACPAGTQDETGEQMTIVEIDTATGSEKEAASENWYRVGRILWDKQGKALIFTAANFGTNLFQIFRLSRSDGEVTPITSELNDYLNISMSADSKFLLAVADERVSNLYVAPSRNPNQTTQIAGGNLEGMGGLAWMSDGRILYVSAASGNRDIWVTDGDGKNRRQLTFDSSADEYPSVTADGRLIAFLSSRAGVPHIWLMNPDGSNRRQLTYRGGEAFPQILPDGSSVVYSGKPLRIWKVPTDGGEPVPLTVTPANWATVSPDGSKIAGLTMKPGLPMRLSVFSAENGEVLQTFDLAGEAGTPRFPPFLRWTPDAQAVGYISTENGVSNIMIQPLGENLPKKLTDFSADRIFAFDWSKDGTKIAFARGIARNKLLLFEDF